MEDSMKKTQIRDMIRSKRALISPEQAAGYDAVLSEQFVSVKDKDLRSLISSASCVALYKAVRGELPCDGIAKFFLENNRTICYPKVKGDEMEFFEITDPDSQFTEGAYGIPEPKSGLRKIYPGDIDLMIVPAIAYSEDGTRLGQGGGFYDRWLNKAASADKAPYTVGVCYDFQIYSALPVQKHDYAVDCIMAVYTED